MRGSAVICAAVLSILGPEFPNHPDVDTESANSVMPGCRSALNEKAGDLYLQGFCYGVVETLVITRSDICAPRGTSPSQAVRVVVQYIDKRPAQLNETFFGLAWQALRSAWPCQH
jgi:Rap1a immunity proteins